MAAIMNYIDNELSDYHKIRNNLRIVRLSRKYLRKGRIKNCLILDGENHITTNILFENGVGLDQIYIPEIDEVPHNKHKSLVSRRRTVNAFHGSMEEFIKNNNLRNFNFGFFDYMGMESGSKDKGISPMGDIYEFLTRTNCKRVTIGITFCIGWWRKRFDVDVEIHEEMWSDYISPMIQHASFQIIHQDPVYIYIGDGKKLLMAFWALVLEKNDTIDTNVEFQVDKKGKLISY